VNLTVEEPIAPTAAGGSFSTAFGTQLAANVAITNPSAGSLSIVVSSPPASGVLTGPDASGDFTWTPGPAFYGSDSFTYSVTNTLSGLSSGPAVVNLSVDAPMAPVANDVSVQTATQKPLLIHLSATPPSGAPSGAGAVRADAIATLTYAIASDPQHGTLSNFDPEAGTVIYTADPGYVGPDSFTFTASYGGETSAPATVSIAVVLIPAVPTADPRSLVLLALLLGVVALMKMR
jgi:hypothetical protein